MKCHMRRGTCLRKVSSINSQLFGEIQAVVQYFTLKKSSNRNYKFQDEKQTYPIDVHTWFFRFNGLNEESDLLERSWMYRSSTAVFLNLCVANSLQVCRQYFSILLKLIFVAKLRNTVILVRISQVFVKCSLFLAAR